MLMLKADFRTHHKTNANRRLRKKNKCPAIIYGKTYENVSIELNQHDIQNPNILEQLYTNNIILLNINHTTSIKVKIKDIQHHPFKLKINHIDFIQIEKSSKN